MASLLDLIRFIQSVPQTATVTTDLTFVDPDRYIGSYGGFVRDEIVSSLKGSNFYASPIGWGRSILWWLSSTPSFVGTVAFTEDGRVAVTPSMLAKMRLKPASKTTKSSYFVNPIKRKSSSYSDSE